MPHKPLEWRNFQHGTATVKERTSSPNFRDATLERLHRWRGLLGKSKLLKILFSAEGNRSSENQKMAQEAAEKHGDRSAARERTVNHS